MRRGLLIVLSGFSGSGKDTVLHRMIEKYPDRYALSISATTRAPRFSEKTQKLETDGEDYFFISKETFENWIKEERFIEYAQYGSNYYGTPKEYVYNKLDEGKDVILEIEVQGALQVKKMFPDTLLVFLTPPDAKTLISRLRGRGSETEEKIRVRMNAAKEEVKFIKEYKYILVNDDLEVCVDQFHKLIDIWHSSVCHNTDLINEFAKQLEEAN